MSKIESFKDLIVYQKAYKLAMEIFESPRAHSPLLAAESASIKNLH
jgi:hypothetical protein